MVDLCKNIRELKFILYGNNEAEPVAEACSQLTQELFRENTLRLLIVCLPKLNLEVSVSLISFSYNLYKLPRFILQFVFRKLLNNFVCLLFSSIDIFSVR